MPLALRSTRCLDSSRPLCGWPVLAQSAPRTGVPGSGWRDIVGIENGTGEEERSWHRYCAETEGGLVEAAIAARIRLVVATHCRRVLNMASLHSCQTADLEGELHIFS